MAGLTCWIGTDVVTQPMMRERLLPDGTRVVDLRLAVGVYSSTARPIPRLSYRLYQNGWSAFQVVVPPRIDDVHFQRRSRGRTKPYAASATDMEFTAWAQDIQDAQRLTKQNAYFALELANLPCGALLEITAAVSVDGERAEEKRAFWLVAPDFHDAKIEMARTTADEPPPPSHPASPDHMFGERAPAPELPDDQWWVLMVHKDREFVTVRLDMLSTTAADDTGGWPHLPAVTVAVNGSPIRVNCMPPPPESDAAIQKYVVPRVDRSDDSVIITFPRSYLNDELRTVTVRTAVGSVREDSYTAVLEGASDPEWRNQPTGLMILHYCNQGWNDLFERPVNVYTPPRDFIGITFRDENAKFSSNPFSSENNIPDGYRFALEAQSDYKIGTHWAFNGGVLSLMKHGLPATEFALLATQASQGLLGPAIAGFGANRPPYYRKESQLNEIRYCEALVRTLLPHPNNPPNFPAIYYPDQRIYLASPDEVAAYRRLEADGLVGYIVLDRSNIAQGQRRLFAHWSEDNPVGNHVWREGTTELRVLPIEDTLRDNFLTQALSESNRGQLAYKLRRLFMAAVRSRAGTTRRLFIYGDDVDHACGDGYFDGQGITYTHNYRASLCWISRHPWVHAWRVDEPGFADAGFERPDPIFISSALDPTVDPGGVDSIDVVDHRIHFNTWYRWWYDKRALWLDRPLGALSDELQAALIAWPEDYRNELHNLAWCYFLAGTHESMWNNQPIGPGHDPNADPLSWQPADFVVSETLQQRNGWVALNASVWATWARSAAGSRAQTYVIAAGGGSPGQVATDLASVQEQLLADPSISEVENLHPYPIPRRDRFGHWDRDWWPTIVLYNKAACVVLDMNGGVITHVFCRLDDGSEAGRVISVAGTFKTHQFLTDPGTANQVECDGDRIQNNVRTPNHGYIGADIRESAWQSGWFRGDNSPDTRDCWYPNNFDAYVPTIGPDNVTFTFQPGSRLPVPVTPDDFARSCVADQARSSAGLAEHVANLAGRAFSKTFTLTMPRNVPVITVQYYGVPAGHMVSNEFAVDLWQAVFTGSNQKIATAARKGLTVSAPGAAVTIRPLRNCAFVAGVGARPEDVQTMYASGLHRVLTDDLRIWCEQGGDFSYEIRLPT